jgi:cytosine/adenosine deaminase-related metal-dependent hydrolase
MIAQGNVTLIEGGTVVAYAGRGHALLPGGQVAFAGDRIVYVGRDYSGPVDTRIYAGGKLVLPGLINHHMAFGIHMQFSRLDAALPNSYNASLGFGVQPQGAYRGGADSTGPQRADWRASAEFAMASALRSGTTTFVMVPNYGSHPYRGRLGTDRELVECVARSGLRAYLALPHMSGAVRGSTTGGIEWLPLSAEGWEGLEHAVDFARTWDGAADGRIRTFLFPYQADNCSPDLLLATKRAAHDLDCLLKIHTAQYLPDFQEVLRRRGRTPIEYLYDLGFLGPEVSVAHAIFTPRHPWTAYPAGADDDTARLAASGATVAHCPVVYARTGFVLHSFSHYVRRGIPVTLGTDTSPHDMLMEMRTAALLCKLTEADARAGTAREVLDAATLGGARALLREDLGRLSPGAKADIVLVDLRQTHLAPVAEIDPIKALVYCARGSDVDTVIVDGVTRVAGGVVLGADLNAIWAGAEQFNARLSAAAAQMYHRNTPLTELYQSAFPAWQEGPA